METKREVRRVPMTWEHPYHRCGLTGKDQYVPLFKNSFREQCEQYGREYIQHGKVAGQKRTRESDHMPDWAESEKTAFQMYETETAGTPLSPVCATKEGLIGWLIEKQVDYFAGYPGTREDWEKLFGL